MPKIVSTGACRKDLPVECNAVGSATLPLRFAFFSKRPWSFLRIFTAVDAIEQMACSFADREENLSERMKEIEEAREADRIEERGAAKLQVYIEGAGERYRFVINNHGEAAARNVRWEIDGESEVSWISWRGEQPIITAPHNSFECHADLYAGMGARERIVLIWDDDRPGDPPRRIETTLALH